MKELNYNIMNFINGAISRYNDKKYWKMKFKIQNNKIRLPIKILYLIRMKRMESFNGASLGSRLNGGSFFKSKPKLPHGLKGIFISDYAKIGKNVTIYQQVTIGYNGIDWEKAPIIGDNVIIYPGAKITGDVIVGDNSIIGTNCVVFENIPSNSLVVLEKPRIILKDRLY